MEQRKVCKNCLHWKPLGPRDGSEYLVMMDARWGECGMAHGYTGGPQTPGTQAFATDADEREATLVTAPDFGCNQWEQGEA